MSKRFNWYGGGQCPPYEGSRRAALQNDAVPLLTAFEGWFSERGGRALPKSPIGQAIAYAQSNWTAMPRFTEHGDLSIDNNLAERMLRAQAIGRRNWTFLGSDRGGRTAAVLYSFTGTCKHHDIDPFAIVPGLPQAAPATGTPKRLAAQSSS